MGEGSPTSRPTNRSIALQLWFIAAIVPIGISFLGGNDWLDFGAFWVAGRMILSGSTHIYGGGYNFPYPPHSLFLFVPFALLPSKAAYIAWNLVTAVFFLVAARAYLPKGFHPLLPLITPAALTCLATGQTGLLLGGLWLFAFRGSWASVALLTFKPHLGVLGMLGLRSWRAGMWTTLAVIALAGLSIAAFGGMIWAEFTQNIIGQAGELGGRTGWMLAGVSPAIGYGLIGWIPFAIAAGLILARNVNAFTAATASMLVSPYGFHYDMTVACLGLGLLVFTRWNQMPVGHRIAIMLGFLVPVLVKTGTWWMPPILLWTLWAQVKYPGFAPQAIGEAALSKAQVGALD